MKKFISVFLSFVLTFVILVRVDEVSAAENYTGGILDGKDGYISSYWESPDKGPTDVTQVTDNNESTFVTLGSTSSSTKAVHYWLGTIDTPKDITGFRIKASPSANNLRVAFIRKDIGTEYITIDSTNNNGQLIEVDMTCVIGVVVTNGAQNTADVFEFNVYGVDGTPAVPTGLSAVPKNNAIDLSWNANTEPNLAGYKVYMDGALLATVNAPSTTYTATGLTNGVSHSFQITAFDTDPCECVKSNEVTASSSATPISIGRALLTITMTNGLEKEYDLSMAEVNAFISWYDAKDAGTGPAKYKFTKTWNKGPFKARSEYVIFDKILTFDVDEYDVTP